MIKAGLPILFIICMGLSYYQGTKSCNSSAQTETAAINKDVVKRTVKRKLPNGTTETETTITDKSKERRAEALIIKQVPLAANRISISALTTNFRELTPHQITYERRVAGPLWLGISVNTKREIGLGVAYEF